MCAKSLQSSLTLCSQVPLSVGFPRQEYWNELPSPLPGNLPDPGIKPTSLMSPALAGSFFTTKGKRKSLVLSHFSDAHSCHDADLAPHLQGSGPFLWRRKWQPTPVFLPGESQGQRSLVGCRLWGRTESDTTEAT